MIPNFHSEGFSNGHKIEEDKSDLTITDKNFKQEKKINFSKEKDQRVSSEAQETIKNKSGRAAVYLKHKITALSSEITSKVSAREIAIIKREFAKVIAKNLGGNRKHLYFKGNTASQNTVIQLGRDLYIPKESVEKEIKHVKSNPLDLNKLNGILHGEYNKPRTGRAQAIQAERDSIAEFGTELIQIYNKEKGNNGEKTATVSRHVEEEYKKELDDLKFKFEGMGLSDADIEARVPSYIVSIKNKLDAAQIFPDLSNVETHYKRDDILSNLYIQLNNETDNVDKIQTCIKELNNQPELFVSATTLKDLKSLSLEMMTKNVQPFISSLTFIQSNRTAELAQTIVKKLNVENKKNQTTFAFKTGLENRRELVAGIILPLLGLEKFVAVKTSVELTGIDLNGVKSPKVIESRWLEGAPAFPEDTWRSMNEARQQLAIAVRDNKSTETIKNLEDKVKICEEAVSLVGTTRNIQELALIDILLCAYDSHIGQYVVEGAQETIVYKKDAAGELIKDPVTKKNVMEKREFSGGKVVNIDFARFLAPASIVTKGDKAFATFRSAFSGHPAMKRPVDPEIIQCIQSWDIEKIVENFEKKGLQADENFFKNSGKKVKSSTTDKGIIDLAAKSTEKDFIGVCEKYHMQILTNESFTDFKARAIQHINEARDKVVDGSFAKIHPRALEEFKARLASTKEYVNSVKQPTLQGVFEICYPQLSKIVKDMQVSCRSPFDEIAFSFDPETQRGGPTNLRDKLPASVLEKAATVEELNLTMSLTL